jgi:hypothetical protein
MQKALAKRIDQRLHFRFHRMTGMPPEVLILGLDYAKERSKFGIESNEVRWFSGIGDRAPAPLIQRQRRLAVASKAP